MNRTSVLAGRARPKKADAVFKIAFALSYLALSRRKRFSSAGLLVGPGPCAGIAPGAPLTHRLRAATADGRPH